MKKLVLATFAASALTIAPASAASLNKQIDLCEAAIMETAQSAFDKVEIDYRSAGGGAKIKKIQFVVEAGGKWGKTSCSINDEDVLKIKWPRALKTQIAAATTAQTQITAENTAAAPSSD